MSPSPPAVLALRNPQQRYDWGSVDRLAAFLGEAPDGTARAELWMGAHPSAPSRVELDPGRWEPLDGVIAHDPARWVGPEVLARFGPVLPFLFKVLAAAQPLSLQLHPSLAAARAGFAAETAAGIPPGHPTRRFSDPNHKPELLVAIDHFDVLSGFRPAAEIGPVLAAFDVPTPWVEQARTTAPGELCSRLWRLDPAAAEELAVTVTRAAARPAVAARYPDECDFVGQAAARHPGDVGLVVGLCLQRVRLAPGQGAFAAPGVLHSYLGGFGLEIMASSDNVLRGGLTTKVVDVEELCRHLVVEPTVARPLSARPQRGDGGVEAAFEVVVDDFALSWLRPDTGPGAAMVLRSPGPEILLCVDGALRLDGSSGGPEQAIVALSRGQSCFVPAATPRYRVQGAGTLYRAQVGWHARAGSPGV